MDSALPSQVQTSGQRSTSERVVEAVAAAEGRDPTELRPPLFTAVDPDALDALLPVDGAPTGVRTISFAYLGHSVVVRSDGTVSIEDG